MRLAALLAAAMLAAGPVLAQDVAEPDGYRMEEYRAPVPATLSGATVVDDDAAHALWKTGRVAFIDVLPQKPKPDNLPEGTVWRDPPRESIPGAIWLPNTGYGDLADETLDYFRNALTGRTGGELTAPLMFFCLQDCWMSWNAARRAMEEGYETVFWYPGGTDGWSAAGHPTEVVQPVAP